MGTLPRDDLVLKPMTIEDIKIYTSPWVQGTRAAAYFGFVEYELSRARPQNAERRQEIMLKSFIDILTGLRAKVLDLGGNAIVGLEIDADPFVLGDIIHWLARGTAAKLEPLF